MEPKTQGDYRKSRSVEVNLLQIAQGAVSTQTVPSDEDRVAVMFGPPDVDILYINATFSAGPGLGWAVRAGDPPLYFDINHHADLVTKAFQTRSGAGSINWLSAKFENVE